MGSEYDSYVRAEWQMFLDNPGRQVETLDAVAGFTVHRVLDVGCGSGQELLPFATKLGASCVGIDAAPEVGQTGRELFARHAPGAHVVFACATAESLPFLDNAFDVAICRLALPYTHNARCLFELARVLRPGGMLLLKIHHARYYASKFRKGIASAQLPSALHAARVLLAGSIYQVTGRQPRLRFPSRETFQTVALLRRELARCGLEIKKPMGDSNPLTPSFLILKQEA